MINSNFVSIILSGINNQSLTNTLDANMGNDDTLRGYDWLNALGSVIKKVNTAGINGSGTYLIFGKGNTPTNDYSLSSEITSGLICHTMTKAFTKSGVIYTSTITNNSTDSITITEIGLCVDCVGANVSYYGKVIVGREEIEPVTLEPGDTKSFTYKINLSVEE